MEQETTSYFNCRKCGIMTSGMLLMLILDKILVCFSVMIVYIIEIDTAFLLVLAYFGIALYQVKYPIAEQRGTT